ncbi:MAG: MotA/TolQ/ExbB proton channel family protein [Spirochaetes bacterium]|nr:MotA/TolQ/ExbB proton channel family protein [Spirochaetota bacterium]
MYPLLIFIFAAIFFIIERIFVYLNFDWKVFNYVDRIINNNIGDNIKIKDQFHYYLNKNYKQFKNVKEKFDTYMEVDCKKIIEYLEKNFLLLNAISAIAPIVGFLGTVWGMVNSFQSISNSTEVTPQLAASGIYQALITTTFGLIITVIASVFFFIFSAIIKRYSSSLEQGVNRINFYLESNQK